MPIVFLALNGEVIVQLREPSKLLIRGGQIDPQVLVVLTGETFTVKTED